MVSARGGVEIEQVAAEDPEAIARLHINPVQGFLNRTRAHWSNAHNWIPKRTTAPSKF